MAWSARAARQHNSEPVLGVPGRRGRQLRDRDTLHVRDAPGRHGDDLPGRLGLGEGGERRPRVAGLGTDCARRALLAARPRGAGIRGHPRRLERAAVRVGGGAQGASRALLRRRRAARDARDPHAAVPRRDAALGGLLGRAPLPARRRRRALDLRREVGLRRCSAAGRRDRPTRSAPSRHERRHAARCAVLLDASGGAINRVPPGATAFVHRRMAYSCQYVAGWNAADGAAGGIAARSWLRATYAAMRPFVSGHAYQNYIDRSCRAGASPTTDRTTRDCAASSAATTRATSSTSRRASCRAR